MRDDLLLLHLLKMLLDLLAESGSLFLLAPLLVDLLGVVVTAPLLVLLSHAKDLAEFLTDVFNECGTVTDQCAFNCVDDWATLTIRKAVAPNHL